MRAIVEGKCNHRSLSPNSINNIGGELLHCAQDSERLNPEHQKSRPEQNGGHQEDSYHGSVIVLN
jgi:hypothetical protein